MVHWFPFRAGQHQLLPLSQGWTAPAISDSLRAGQPQLQPQLFKFTGLPQDWTVPVVGIHWPHRRAGQPQVFKFLGFPQDWNTSVVAIFAFAQGVCLSGVDSPRLFFTKLFVEF